MSPCLVLIVTLCSATASCTNITFFSADCHPYSVLIPRAPDAFETPWQAITGNSNKQAIIEKTFM